MNQFAPPGVDVGAHMMQNKELTELWWPTVQPDTSQVAAVSSPVPRRWRMCKMSVKSLKKDKVQGLTRLPNANSHPRGPVWTRCSKCFRNVWLLQYSYPEAPTVKCVALFSKADGCAASRDEGLARPKAEQHHRRHWRGPSHNATSVVTIWSLQPETGSSSRQVQLAWRAFPLTRAARRSSHELIHCSCFIILQMLSFSERLVSCRDLIKKKIHNFVGWWR